MMLKIRRFCAIKISKKLNQIQSRPYYNTQALSILKEQNECSKISASRFQSQLGAINVLKFDKISSTMMVSEKWLRDDIDSNNHFIFIAQSQIKGRGQRDNKWLSPPGNIYCSILTRQPSTILQSLYLASTVSIALTIESQFKLKNDIGLKWVNDLYLKDQKFGGILINTDVQNATAIVQIGIGINVNSAPTDQFTCLHKHRLNQMELASLAKLDSVIVNMTVRILETFNQVATQKQHVFKRYTEKLLMINKRVVIFDSTLKNEIAKGKFIGVTSSGFALLQTERGVIQISNGRMRIQK